MPAIAGISRLQSPTTAARAPSRDPESTRGSGVASALRPRTAGVRARRERGSRGWGSLGRTGPSLRAFARGSTPCGERTPARGHDRESLPDRAKGPPTGVLSGRRPRRLPMNRVSPVVVLALLVAAAAIGLAFTHAAKAEGADAHKIAYLHVSGRGP